jgi:hypothetical protein
MCAAASSPIHVAARMADAEEERALYYGFANEVSAALPHRTHTPGVSRRSWRLIATSTANSPMRCYETSPRPTPSCWCIHSRCFPDDQAPGPTHEWRFSTFRGLIPRPRICLAARIARRTVRGPPDRISHTGVMQQPSGQWTGAESGPSGSACVNRATSPGCPTRPVFHGPE